MYYRDHENDVGTILADGARRRDRRGGRRRGHTAGYARTGVGAVASAEEVTLGGAVVRPRLAPCVCRARRAARRRRRNVGQRRDAMLAVRRARGVGVR